MSGRGKAALTVTCPRCARDVVWGPASPFRPFCSQRCKMMDFGAWATEKYRVATDDATDDRDGRDDSDEPH